jgi:hypothetical protein
MNEVQLITEKKPKPWRIVKIGVILSTLTFFWTLRSFDVPPDPNDSVPIMAASR